MNASDWRKLFVVFVLGSALGCFSTRIIDAFGFHPLLAVIPGVFSACVLAFVLRRSELPSFFAECAVFAYANYLGIAFSRAAGHDNAFASAWGATVEGWVSGLTPLVLLVGIGYAGVVVGFGVVVWGVAQRFNRTEAEERDARFLEFLDSETRRGI